MKNFYDYMKDCNIEAPRGNIPGTWFSQYGIPMVVRCSCCGMTMASPSAWMDEEGYTYCGECADIEEE